MNLAPPPPDARPGSKDAPWLRLTDWEMMNLRKRMKKNAKWRPSESMVKLELMNAGRGPHNYWEAKRVAEDRGLPFLDVDNIANNQADKPLAWGEVSLTAPSSSEEKPRNKGMVLNEAKKRKRAESSAYLGHSSSASTSSSSEEPRPRKKATLSAPSFGRSPDAQDSPRSPMMTTRLLSRKAMSSVATASWAETVNQDLPTSSTGETQIGQDAEPNDAKARKSDFASFAMNLLNPINAFSEASPQQGEQQAREGATTEGSPTKSSTTYMRGMDKSLLPTATTKPSITRQPLPEQHTLQQMAPQRSSIPQASPHTQVPVPEIRTHQQPKSKPLFDHRQSLAKIVGKKAKSPPPMLQPPPMTKPSPVPKPSPVSRPSPKTKTPSGIGKPAAKRRYIPGGPGGGGRYVDL